VYRLGPLLSRYLLGHFQCKCKTTLGMGHNNVPSNDINSYLLCHNEGIYSTLVFMEINELYLVSGHKTNAQNGAFCWSSLPNATPTVKMPKLLPPKCGPCVTSTNRQVLTAHRHRLSHDRRTGPTVEACDSQTDRQTNGHCIMPPTPSIMGVIEKINIA